MSRSGNSCSSSSVSKSHCIRGFKLQQLCLVLVVIGRQASTREYDCSILSDPVPSREQGFFFAEIHWMACIWRNRADIQTLNLADRQSLSGRESQHAWRETGTRQRSIAHAGIKSCLPRRLHGLTLEARAVAHWRRLSSETTGSYRSLHDDAES